MSVYEAVMVCKEKSGKLYEKVNITSVLRHICCFGLGVLFSLAGFNESFSPFGVAFVGCVSKRFTITATAGSVIGYFVALDSVSALRYTASVLALAVVMTALKSFKGLREHMLTPSVVSFTCVFVTGLAVVVSKEFSVFNLLITFCESALGGAAAFVFYKSRVYLTMRGGIRTVTSKEITGIVITGAILLLAFKYVTVFEVSFAHIIATFLILLCATYAKESGGSIVGICCGVTMSLGSNNLFVLSFYSLGGLLSGAFSGFGRLASLASFVLSGVAIAVISGYSDNLIPLVVETAVASVIFLVVSHKFNYELRDFFTPSITAPIIETVKSNIINKLQKASEFSSEICRTLDSVNAVLSKSEKSNVKLIPQKTKTAVCSSCGLYDVCWVEMKEETSRSFNELLNLKKNGTYLDLKSAPQNFASVCIRTESISDSFNKLFSECKIHEKAENRIKEIQTLASEQFVNVSDLLTTLCDEINEEVKFDMDIAARCKAVALSQGFKPIDCCCVCDSFEHITLEMRLEKPVDRKNLNKLTEQLSLISGRNLEQPETDEFDEYIKAVFFEKPEYKIISACVQFNANGEKYSGDTYTTFYDGKGWFYALVCDGMGTGAKAAVSSSLAVNLLEKLIKAGFGIRSAIKTVNTSLVSKSNDECSVTLDLIALDMYTGRVEFYKCGANNTLHKRKGKVSDITIQSLPMGILNEVDIGFSSSEVSIGDVIVACSDGVREEDFWQLRNAVKVFDNGNVQDFTTEISGVIRRSQPEKNDDFTMLTIAVTSNK